MVYDDFRYKLTIVYYYVAHNYILIVLVSNADDGWKFTCCRLHFVYEYMLMTIDWYVGYWLKQITLD